MKTLFHIAIFLVALSATAYAMSPSESRKNCFGCHALTDNGMRLRLKMPISELCKDCHKDMHTFNDHAVDIKPSMSVQDLPLDRQGHITCITCHEPHGLTGNVKLLRARPSELCGICHRK